MNSVNTMNAAAVSAAPRKRRSFYTRVTALGYGLITLTGLVYLVWSLVSGGSEGLGFGVVIAAVGLAVAGAVWRFGRWALVVAALLSLAVLALLVPFSIFSLGHPESGRDFIPLVLLVAGALLGFIGGVVALIQGRSGVRERATGAERLGLGIVLGATALAIVVSLVLTLTSRSVVPAEARAGAQAVEMRNFSFVPDLLQVKAGDKVRVVVRNDDPTLHTFTLPQAGVDVSVPPGSEKVVEFVAPASGIYQWHCIPHANKDGSTWTGMVGTLQVQ